MNEKKFILSIVLSLTYLFMNLYNVDNSIQLKEGLWKRFSDSWIDLELWKVTYKQSKTIDFIVKGLVYILVVLLVLALGFTNNVEFIWSSSVLILISVVFFIYTTLVFNQFQTDGCYPTQLSLYPFYGGGVSEPRDIEWDLSEFGSSLTEWATFKFSEYSRVLYKLLIVAFLCSVLFMNISPNYIIVVALIMTFLGLAYGYLLDSYELLNCSLQYSLGIYFYLIFFSILYFNKAIGQS